MTDIVVRCSCGRKAEKAPCLRGGPSGLVPLGEDGTIRLQCDDECEEQRRLTAFAKAIGTTPTSLTVMRSVGRTSGGSVGEDGRTTYTPFLLEFAMQNPLVIAHFEREIATIVIGKTRRVDFGALPQLFRAVLHSMAELHLLDSKATGSGSQATRRIVVAHRGAGSKPVFPVPSLSEAAGKEEALKREQNSPLARSLFIFVPRTPGQPASMDIEARIRRELSTHLSAMKLLHREVMPDAKNEEGLLVEFSTLPRLELALSSLKTRPGVVVTRPHVSVIRAPNSRAQNSRAADSTGNPRPQPDVISSPWGSTSPSGAGVPSYMRETPLLSSMEGVPDSWEDA